jgi:hypothetical protein
MSLFTQQELIKLHARFGHPATERLMQFLNRATPDDVDENTRKTLEGIAERCRACASSRTAPRVFKARSPHDGVFFNAEVIVDIFFISGQWVLSVVDRDTRFQSAMVLTHGTKAIQVWQACCSTGCADTSAHLTP